MCLGDATQQQGRESLTERPPQRAVATWDSNNYRALSHQQVTAFNEVL